MTSDISLVICVEGASRRVAGGGGGPAGRGRGGGGGGVGCVGGGVRGEGE